MILRRARPRSSVERDYDPPSSESSWCNEESGKGKHVYLKQKDAILWWYKTFISWQTIVQVNIYCASVELKWIIPCHMTHDKDKVTKKKSCGGLQMPCLEIRPTRRRFRIPYLSWGCIILRRTSSSHCYTIHLSLMWIHGKNNWQDIKY